MIKNNDLKKILVISELENKHGCVHCQHAGHPIIGDRKYGSTTRGEEGTAEKEAVAKYLCLHAAELRFQLPGTDSLFQVSAPWDKSFAAQVSRFREILSNSD